MKLRIYFNCWADDPLIWSVDQGTSETEIKVRSVACSAAFGTAMDKSVARGDTRNPRVWMECFGKLTIVDEVAHIA